MRRLSELMDLTGRNALVTGGAGYIALAVEEALCELGTNVIIADMDYDACLQRAARLKEIGSGQTEPLFMDLSNEEQTRSSAKTVAAEFGGIDILVHCAAYTGNTQLQGWAAPFEKQELSAWDAAMRVNLSSAFVLAQELSGYLRASGHGSIILLSSIYGIVGPDMRLYEGTNMANAAGYNASKGGILQLTRYLATVFAPNVRVNAITPGGVWRNQPEIFNERYKSRTPLNRMATEEDFKGAVAYLASDLSAYVTGHNMVVDGGWTAW